MKRLLQNKKLTAALVLSALCGATYGYHLLTADERSTENAYLNADVVEVAPQVNGKVSAVHVHDNQPVKKGDLLFELDPEALRIALARAEAGLAQAHQNARQDSAEIATARAQVAQTEVDLVNANHNYARSQELVAQHFQSQQAADDAHTKVLSLQAALAQAQAKLAKAQAVPQDADQRADILKAEADLAQAKLDLGHARVVAEQDGIVTNVTLTTGSLVKAGVPLFALIARDSFHIDANFKETELDGLRPGQRADVKVDMYPDHPFHGVVESLSGGTGTAFSLLPPQNATGNWVKIAQRVPVRIKLDAPDPAYPLRIGATATVTVHLH
jgi:membrane fusion protein (multidrug efflux system)